jgi:DNA-binding NarL/FixJ family response regulator
MKTATALVAEAKARIQNLSPNEVARELEVLHLVSVGRTNREIARELFLSPRTIDMHVRNVLTKLGCRSRTEATRRAVELGLLKGDPRSRRPAAPW